MGALPTIEFYELGLLHPKDPQTLQVSFDLSRGRGRRAWIDEDGYVSVPDLPGIGAEVDEAYVQDHLVASYRIGEAG